MGIPVFESCCFCIPLRVGTLILGYLHLIVAVIGIIASAFMILGGAVLTSGAIDLKDHDFHFNDDGRHSGISNDEAIKMGGVLALVVGIILLILCIVQFIFVIFLLIGGHNGKPGHIKAYLVFSVVMLVITLILTIVSLIAAPSIGVISHFFSYALEIYFLLVIRSYMVQLQDNPEGDRAGKVYKSVYDAAP